VKLWLTLAASPSEAFGIPLPYYQPIALLILVLFEK